MARKRRGERKSQAKKGTRSRTVTIKAKGKEPVRFRKGGLHRSLGVKEGERIPAEKMRAALAGRYGPKAKKQAQMAVGMLKKGRQTAARNRRARRAGRKSRR